MAPTISFKSVLRGIAVALVSAVAIGIVHAPDAGATDRMQPLNAVKSQYGVDAQKKKSGSYVYKPDAIPLSQYRPDTIGVSGLTNQVNLTSKDKTHDREFYLAIYSGSTTGVYFRVAGKICELMQRTFAEHHIHCVPLRSQGVASNVQLMKDGRAQVAIVQSNTNWNAANGVSPIPGARSVMSLHDEMGLLVVRKDAGIHSVADLRGKRLNLGPEGSASRALWDQLLDAYGMSEKDLKRVYGVAQDYNEIGICDNYIDAFGLWIGHPAIPIRETLENCDAEIVGMSGPQTDELIRKNGYFFKQTLPAGAYPGQKKAVQSYGFKASLIAYQPASPYVIYWLTRIVRENVALLRTLDPALYSLNTTDFEAKGNFLPFHRGAACYWKGDDKDCAWQAPYLRPAVKNIDDSDIIPYDMN